MFQPSDETDTGCFSPACGLRDGSVWNLAALNDSDDVTVD